MIILGINIVRAKMHGPGKMVVRLSRQQLSGDQHIQERIPTSRRPPCVLHPTLGASNAFSDSQTAVRKPWHARHRPSLGKENPRGLRLMGEGLDPPKQNWDAALKCLCRVSANVGDCFSNRLLAGLNRGVWAGHRATSLCPQDRGHWRYGSKGDSLLLARDGRHSTCA